mgnify:CR=1 FL=1
MGRVRAFSAAPHLKPAPVTVARLPRGLGRESPGGRPHNEGRIGDPPRHDDIGATPKRFGNPPPAEVGVGRDEPVEGHRVGHRSPGLGVENVDAGGGKLVEELFDISRMEAGELPLRARRRDLGLFLRTLLERFVHEAPEGRRCATALALQPTPVPG